MATTTVLYPKGCKFDMVRHKQYLLLQCLLSLTLTLPQDYYLKTHMPLVASSWTQYGLKSWKVVKFDDDAPHSVQATLEWGSLDDFKKAATSESAAKVMGDVANFTDGQPTLGSGDVVGSG